MPDSSLDRFIGTVRSNWTGLDTNTVVKTRRLLEELALATPEEPWLAVLHRERPATVELYRDPDRGFLLLAHTEPCGHYRPPHNHGTGFVFYALHHGTMRMATYSQVTHSDGTTRLVSRGADLMHEGECRVFLPGDIHDTEVVSDYIVQFRLTSSDFSLERSAGRMVVYAAERRGRAEDDGV